MTSLLHIDSSIRPSGSVSRRLSSYYATAWRQNHPGSDYVYRDLAAEPIPHITHAVHQALLDPSLADRQTPDEKALTEALVGEMHDATAVVLGVPMHNYTVPSSVKAWIDRIASPANMVPPGADSGPLSGKSVVIITARGGSYAPGTPREGFDHQEPYLRALMRAIGLEKTLTFVHAELTLTATVPVMAPLKPMAEESLKNAYEALDKLAA